MVPDPLSVRFQTDVPGIVRVAGRTFVTVAWLIAEHPDHPLLKKTVLHSNGDRTPVRSELDMLIMEVGR